MLVASAAFIVATLSDMSGVATWVADVRLGVLLVIPIELGRTLVHALRPDPVVVTLETLRRMRAIGELTPVRARRELELLFFGADTNALLQVRLATLLEAFREVRASLGRLTTHVDKILAGYSSRTRGPQSADERAQIESESEQWLASLDAHATLVESKVGPASRALNGALAAAGHGCDDRVIEKVRERVRDELEEIGRRKSVMETRVAEMKSIFGRRRANAARRQRTKARKSA